MPHQCIPIVQSKKSLKYGMLSSNEIDNRKLVEPDIVIAKYPHYHKKDKISTLAIAQNPAE